MKLNLFLYLIILIVFPVFAISDQQNQNNLAYLDELDLRLVESIELITAFNEIAGNMKTDIQGAKEFSHFLFDLTMQTASIRKMIKESLDVVPDRREEIIRLIMAELKPQEILPLKNILPNKDADNINFLERRILIMQNQINSYRSQIVAEENIILDEKVITTKYISLHNRHFIYSMLRNMTEIHHYLSPTNRQYLRDLIQSIDINIYKKEL